ncbi:MAG: LysE family transporter [Bacteroidales bacterium]|nr:LysE family transporter [Candidatus Liminaster caballi]
MLEDIIATAILTTLWGLMFGVLVSAPMGPTGILVIQRTLNKGWLPGLATGVGAVLSDLFYAVLSTFAVSLVVDWIEKNQPVLLLAGGVLIAVYGVYLWTSNPATALTGKDKVSASEMRSLRSLRVTGLLKFFFSGFGLTVSNPAIVFFYLVLFSRAGFIFVAADDQWGFYLLFFAAIMMGAFGWWVLITWAINKVRNHFKIRTLKVINRVIAVIMIIIAVCGVANGVMMLV